MPQREREKDNKREMCIQMGCLESKDVLLSFERRELKERMYLHL